MAYNIRIDAQNVRTYTMKILTKTRRIRFSENDILLMESLKKYRVKPTTFLREAFREKIHRDKPIILEQENKRVNKLICPF